jgi:hypothetical protein
MKNGTLSRKNRPEETMAASLDKKSDTDAQEPKLSEKDTRLLLVVCTELINLCARVAGKIDPTATAMLAYVSEEIKVQIESELR